MSEGKVRPRPLSQTEANQTMRHFSPLMGCGLFGLLLLGSLSALAAPIPLPSGDSPVDLARLRSDNPAVLPMAGTWRFDLTQGAMAEGKFVQSPATAPRAERPA